MITLPELLKDSVYKNFFIKVPWRPPTKPPTPPWRLYVQREIDGPWAKREVWTYAQAFDLYKRLSSLGLHDAAIQSKGIAYRQPTRVVKITRNGQPVMVKGSNGQTHQMTKEVLWTPKLPEGEGQHIWCSYCRRPTVFALFSRHHAFQDMDLDISKNERCTICGSSLPLVRGY